MAAARYRHNLDWFDGGGEEEEEEEEEEEDKSEKKKNGGGEKRLLVVERQSSSSSSEEEEMEVVGAPLTSTKKKNAYAAAAAVDDDATPPRAVAATAEGDDDAEKGGGDDDAIGELIYDRSQQLQGAECGVCIRRVKAGVGEKEDLFCFRVRVIRSERFSIGWSSETQLPVHRVKDLLGQINKSHLLSRSVSHCWLGSQLARMITIKGSEESQWHIELEIRPEAHYELTCFTPQSGRHLAITCSVIQNGGGLAFRAIDYQTKKDYVLYFASDEVIGLFSDSPTLLRSWKLTNATIPSQPLLAEIVKMFELVDVEPKRGPGGVLIKSTSPAEKRLVVVDKEQRHRRAKRRAAVMQIQSRARGNVGRRKAHGRKLFVKVSIMQRMGRLWRNRRALRTSLTRLIRDRRCMIIQRAWRGHICRARLRDYCGQLFPYSEGQWRRVAAAFTVAAELPHVADSFAPMARDFHLVLHYHAFAFDYDRASVLYNALLDTDPRNPVVLFGFAMLLETTSKFNEGGGQEAAQLARQRDCQGDKMKFMYSWFRDAAQLRPEHPEALINHAIGCWHLAFDFEAATGIIDQALVLEPGSARLQRIQKQLAAQCEIRREAVGKIERFWHRHGRGIDDDSMALIAIVKALLIHKGIHSKYLDDKKDIALLLEHTFVKHCFQHNNRVALQLYRKALRIDPKNSSAHYGISILLFLMSAALEAAIEHSITPYLVSVSATAFKGIKLKETGARGGESGSSAADSTADRAKDCHLSALKHLHKAEKYEDASAASFEWLERTFFLPATKMASGVRETIAQSLCNYALFSQWIKRDYGQADALFQRAMETDPLNEVIAKAYSKFCLDFNHGQSGLVSLGGEIDAGELARTFSSLRASSMSI